MRVFFVYPTRTTPAGGIKQIRLTTSLLRSLGVDAYLMRDSRFWSDPDKWDDNGLYRIDVPIAEAPFERGSEIVQSDDVVVLPEVGLGHSLKQIHDWNVRVAVNNQNGFAAIRDRPLESGLLTRIEFVIANAPYVAAVSHYCMQVPWERIFYVPHWIVRGPVDIGPQSPESKLAVSYMPRKLPKLVEQVRLECSRRHPDVPWIEIDGRPESEVMEKLRSCKVFFAAQHLEGCPMTALEAMCCSAIVAGYPGTRRFPHPYATSANGWWAVDNSVNGAVAAINNAIAMAKSSGAEYDDMIRAGHRTAAAFCRESVEGALGAMVSTVVARAYALRGDVVPYRLGTAGLIEMIQRKYSWVWFKTRAGRIKRTVGTAFRGSSDKQYL